MAIRQSISQELARPPFEVAWKTAKGGPAHQLSGLLARSRHMSNLELFSLRAPPGAPPPAVALFAAPPYAAGGTAS